MGKGNSQLEAFPVMRAFPAILEKNLFMKASSTPTAGMSINTYTRGNVDMDKSAWCQ